MTLSLRRDGNGEPGIHVDMAAFEAPMKAALKDTSVYLGYALYSSAREPLASVGLNASIELEVGVPDPLPLEDRQCYQRKYESWVIGQALVELDQSYHRFLVAAIHLKSDLQEFVARRRLASKKAILANTWTVHERLFQGAERSPQEREFSGYLRSLGNARNCLVHDSGTVTLGRLNDHDTMRVRWRGRDMFQTQQSGEVRLLPRDRPFVCRTEDVGTQLQVQQVPIASRF